MLTHAFILAGRGRWISLTSRLAYSTLSYKLQIHSEIVLKRCITFISFCFKLGIINRQVDVIKVTWARERLLRPWEGKEPEEETVLLKASDTDVCVFHDAGLVFSAIS